MNKIRDGESTVVFKSRRESIEGCNNHFSLGDKLWCGVASVCFAEYTTEVGC